MLRKGLREQLCPGMNQSWCGNLLLAYHRSPYAICNLLAYDVKLPQASLA